MAQDTTNSKVQLAEVFAQSQQNSQQIVVLAKAVDGLRESITVGFNEVRDKISDRDKPNFQLAMVIIAIIGTIGGSVAFSFYREMDKNQAEAERQIARAETDMRRTTDMLDIKLQREFQLAMETTKEGIKGLDSVSASRHEQAIKETQGVMAKMLKLEGFLERQTENDLQELRTIRKEQREKTK